MLRKVVDLNGRCDHHMLGLFFLINHGLINCRVFSPVLAYSGLEGAWYVLRTSTEEKERKLYSVGFFLKRVGLHNRSQR